RTHAAAQAVCLPKVPLCRSAGHPFRFTAHDRVNDGVTRDEFFLHKPGHEGLRVLEVGVFPRRAVEPERPTRCVRKRYILSIAEKARGELRHERAELEADAQPLAFCGTIGRRGLRLWPTDREERSVPEPRHSAREMG